MTTSDSIITPERVEVYMPAAVGYVMLVQYRNQIRFDDTRDLPEDFILPYILPVAKDELGHKYSTFTVRPLSFPQNRGIRFVGPEDYSDKYIVQSEGAIHAFKFYNQTLDAGIVRVRPEGNRLYFQNLPDSAEKVKVKIVPNPIDLNEDDELPLPAGYEVDVMDIMEKFFTGEKAVPKDFIADQKDIVSGNKV